MKCQMKYLSFTYSTNLLAMFWVEMKLVWYNILFPLYLRIFSISVKKCLCLWSFFPSFYLVNYFNIGKLKF